jgi:hypothetical protein
MDDQRSDREGGKFRFSLKALLILITLIALSMGAYFGGRLAGYQQGYQTGSADGIRWARNNPEKK